MNKHRYDDGGILMEWRNERDGGREGQKKAKEGDWMDAWTMDRQKGD